MADISAIQQKPDPILAQLVRHTVLPEFARRRPGRVLLVSPFPEAFPLLGGWNVLTLKSGAHGAAGPVQCDSASLPFQEGSFEAVLLHNVAVDGSEPEVHEAWRVLCPGGDIFVLGHGSLGWRARVCHRGRGQPRLRVLQVCQQLRRRAFAIEQCAGSGLLGMPLYWERRWQRPGLPLADAVLIHGRHRPLRPIVRPLHFGRTQTVGVRSAVADTLLRETG